MQVMAYRLKNLGLKSISGLKKKTLITLTRHAKEREYLATASTKTKLAALCSLRKALFIGVSNTSCAKIASTSTII